MRIAYISTNSGITAVIDGQQYTITSDNPSYRQVIDAIREQASADEIALLFRTANAVRRYAKGAIEVAEDGSALFYKGEEINNVVVDRILGFMSDGLPVDPLIKFLERLLANPSRRSVEELYKFLEHGKMPITEAGTFLAYKGVNDDYTDVHSGRFSNRVGIVNSMPRNQVNDDFRVGCSVGFHVGSLEYATGWGSRTVIVEVDPADVVSVPDDCSCQKLRTCKYQVIEDYAGALNDNFARAKSPYANVAADFADDDDDDDNY